MRSPGPNTPQEGSVCWDAYAATGAVRLRLFAKTVDVLSIMTNSGSLPLNTTGPKTPGPLQRRICVTSLNATQAIYVMTRYCHAVQLPPSHSLLRGLSISSKFRQVAGILAGLLRSLWQLYSSGSLQANALLTRTAMFAQMAPFASTSILLRRSHSPLSILFASTALAASDCRSPHARSGLALPMTASAVELHGCSCKCFVSLPILRAHALMIFLQARIGSWCRCCIVLHVYETVYEYVLGTSP